jgi:hypothetical protein
MQSGRISKPARRSGSAHRQTFPVRPAAAAALSNSAERRSFSHGCRMMQICNTNNELSLSEFNSQCCRSAPVGSRDKGAAVFWLLLLLFGVTLGIALAGQRLLERHSQRGVKK